MIFFGAANVVNYFRAGTIPTMFSTNLGTKAIVYMRSFSKGISFPTVIFVGMLAGLHNFPCACTGGIYMTFLGLVSSSPLFLPYLITYNVIFIIPLLGILLFCSSKMVTLKFRKWHETNKERAKLIIGVLMLAVGFLIIGLLAVGLI